jgi:hypothetical protein
MSTKAIVIMGVVAVALVGTAVYAAQNRIEICHATDDIDKPWNTITVSERSWSSKHEAHGDKYPVPAGGCDAGEGPPPPPGGVS